MISGNVFGKKMTAVIAAAMSVMIAMQPVTAFAAEEVEIEGFEIEAAVETAEDVVEETAEVVTEDVAEAAEEVAVEIAEESTDVVTEDAESSETVVEETVVEDDAEETTVETVEDEETVVEDVETAEESDDVVAEDSVETVEDAAAVAENVEEVAAEETAAPAFDKKATKYLKEAAKNNALLSVNSYKEGLAATNQVSRCREMAKNLLVFQYKYIYGQEVIGTAYDMNLGDNNYILLHMIDPSTGEAYIKYFDFYMQDAKGNNVTNMFKYHTVDHITVVEKGEYTGDWKLGMFSHPTFANKSNGTVVFDSSSYSQLISDEYISYVESIANAQ